MKIIVKYISQDDVNIDILRKRNRMTIPWYSGNNLK